jgi:hypothetical protein
MSALGEMRRDEFVKMVRREVNKGVGLELPCVQPITCERRNP